MTRPARFSQPQGMTPPVYGSPLPQEEPPRKATPVRVVGAFNQALPERTRLFFERIYFAPIPVAFQVAGLPPYPLPLPIATIQAPQYQAIVLREARFRVFQHSGIAIDDFVEVAPTRVFAQMAFELRIGNRGLTDYNTNLTARGVPVSATGQAVAGAPQAGQGSLFPYAGVATPTVPQQSFASYVRPGDEIKATAFVLRPLLFDARFVAVELSGWIATEKEVDRIIDLLDI